MTDDDRRAWFNQFVYDVDIELEVLTDIRHAAVALEVRDVERAKEHINDARELVDWVGGGVSQCARTMLGTVERLLDNGCEPEEQIVIGLEDIDNMKEA